MSSFHEGAYHKNRTNILSLDYRFTPVWIGLSAPNPDIGYVWSDESPVSA